MQCRLLFAILALVPGESAWHLWNSRDLEFGIWNLEFLDARPIIDSKDTLDSDHGILLRCWNRGGAWVEFQIFLSEGDPGM